MRKLMTVAESWLGRSGFTGEHEALNSDILLNPSRTEVFKMIRTSRYHELRAFLLHNLYVWDGSTFVHHDFPKDLIRPEDAECIGTLKGTKGRRCVNLHLDARGPYIPWSAVTFSDDDEAVPDANYFAAKEFVDNHPLLKRIYGKVDLQIKA